MQLYSQHLKLLKSHKSQFPRCRSPAQLCTGAHGRHGVCVHRAITRNWSDLDALQQLNALDAIRDELRGRVSEVKLPGIVVVGNQSSGKSSVLESISRVPLPRGQRTTTRCPIQLSVRQGEPFAATVQRGAELTSPDAVSGAIKAKMNELCPAGRFSEDPVTVSIRQPSGPNLTRIDLPGLIALFDNPNKALIDSLVEDYLASGISGT